jgi:hypothetical protein
LGNESGSVEGAMIRPLSPPPRESVSASAAAPERGAQPLPRPLSPPPQELVSAGNAAPGWGAQPELNWGAGTSSTPNEAVPPSERPVTAGVLPRMNARPPPTEPRSMRDKGKGAVSRSSTEYRDKGKGKAKSSPSLGDRLSEPSSSSAQTAKVPLEQQLSNPSVPLADRLQAPRPFTLAERLQGPNPMPLASRLAPPAPMAGPLTSVQLPAGPLQLEGTGPSSLAEWLATHPSTDTLPRCFAVLLQHDHPHMTVARTVRLSIPRTLRRLEECDEGIERDTYRESSLLCERKRKLESSR